MKPRVYVAFVLGFLLIFSAFALKERSLEYQAFADPGPEDSVSATFIRGFIPTPDSNNDGVDDWQETIVGDNTITINGSSTAVASDTLTAQYGSQLAKLHQLAQEQGFDESVQTAITKKAERELLEQVDDKKFTEEDLMLVDLGDEEFLHAYGNNIALIAVANTFEEYELAVFIEAMNSDDESRLMDLKPIIETYDTIIEQTLAIQVPEDYSFEHITLVNAYLAVRNDIYAMQFAFTDPLYTKLRLERYQDDWLGMNNAIRLLYNTLYLKDKVRWEEGDPTLSLVSFEE